MTVAELKDLLDDYGDHLEVVIEHDETGFFYTPSVEFRSMSGMVTIAIGDKIDDA